MSALPWEIGDASERVLVVDDDDAGRYSKSRILRQAGYRIVEAANGAEALRRIADYTPDLVLLDVRLPDVSGLEVCRKIKTNPDTSSIPVLQMSASFQDDQAKIAGLQCGADGYITEPIDPALLLATIGAFLRTRRAEEAVREHALEWQTTFDAIGDGVALVDTAGRILRSNRALAEILGRRPEQLAWASLDELLPSPEGVDLWTRLEAGRRQSAERTVSGRTFSLRVDPVCNHRGQLRGAVCIVSDVTERKLMDERLWHTQKLESIGLLAGGVAHDFNNLLMGILGNASLALEALSDPVAAGRALRDIVRASERAADLTRQLLAYAGKGRFVVQRIDLSRAVGELLPLVKTSFPRKVDLVLDLSGSLPAIQADKTQVEQIVMNLLINAAEAIGDNPGTVGVTTAVRIFREDARADYLAEDEIRGEYVVLEVRDTGAGMDAETLRRIFDPFFTTKFLGRGLGLSAVLGIVRGHKGAIRVASTPGRGTTFELLFPSAGSTAVAGEPGPPEFAGSEDSPRGTVLVVDDEVIVRNFFAAALERRGYEVVTASDGAEAVRIFAEAPLRFSVILLDLAMPVMNGKDALPLLLELRPDARIVITSGQVEEQVRRELREWPVAGFIQKPCPVKELLAKVRQVAAPGIMAAG